MGVRSVDHVSFTVSDLERSVAFWTLLLGSPPESRMVYSQPVIAELVGYDPLHMDAAYFRLPGGPLLELFQYRQPAGEQPTSRETYVTGSAHLGLIVDGLDELHARLQGSGATFRTPGPVTMTEGAHAGIRGLYVRDPDGITIELLEPPAAR